MKHGVWIAVVSLVLAGCGESRFNPFNWFRGGVEVETFEPIDIVEDVEGRPLVAEISSLVVEPTPGGAIVRAVGLPPTQGWWDADLVNVDPDGDPVDGVMTYTFRARPPLDPARVSTPQSREISAAVTIPSVTLARVSQVRVTAETNARVARR